MNVLWSMLNVNLCSTVRAGGILTNTNQSVLFLKNPARDGAIGLDGVYSNPAGVVFMPEGFHIAFNWQYAHQTRTITSVNPVFALGRKNNGNTTKVFEGVADAPIIPSLQAAYNTGDWSIQFNFSVPGGGGKCEFADGLGSFESVVGSIANMLQPLGAQGYDMDGYMRGRQYYYGIQLGAAYKVNRDFSVYGGLRLLYGDATYKAKISNIQVKTAGGYVDFSDFMLSATGTVKTNLSLVNAAIEAAGMDIPADLQAKKAQLEGTLQNLGKLQKYAQGVNLLCNQTSLGIAPVIGADYKFGNFNIAAKYEFKTQVRMKNESTVNEASEIAAVNKFRDGEEVNEDAPALLTVGLQWKPVEAVSLNAGYGGQWMPTGAPAQSSSTTFSDNTSLSLGLSIPIFDRGSSVTQYKQSKITLQQAELQHYQTLLDLRDQLNELYINTQQALNRYKASEVLSEAYRASYEVYVLKYTEGAVTTVEMLQQQDKYLSASNEYLQNKYSFLLAEKQLDIYTGKEIKL